MQPRARARAHARAHAHRGNSLGVAGWDAAMAGLSQLSSLTSLNGYDGFAQLRHGGLTELDLEGRELGVAVRGLLGRSRDSLTSLNLR